jgi:hypothetical protein
VTITRHVRAEESDSDDDLSAKRFRHGDQSMRGVAMASFLSMVNFTTPLSPHAQLPKPKSAAPDDPKPAAAQPATKKRTTAMRYAPLNAVRKDKVWGGPSKRWLTFGRSRQLLQSAAIVKD